MVAVFFDATKSQEEHGVPSVVRLDAVVCVPGMRLSSRSYTPHQRKGRKEGRKAEAEGRLCAMREGYQ